MGASDRSRRPPAAHLRYLLMGELIDLAVRWAIGAACIAAILIFAAGFATGAAIL